MKFPLLLILLFSGRLFAQNTLTPQQYQELGNRFVTTIQETQVDQQLLSVAAVNDCVTQNTITAADMTTDVTVNGKTMKVSQQKREAAKTCFVTKMGSASEADLQQLSSQLKLDQFGLVQGQSTKELTDYFVSRIQNALYGTGATGAANQARDKTLVDHDVFYDIYSSRISKNFLLEVSRYCLQDLAPEARTTPTCTVSPGNDCFFKEWERLILNPTNQATAGGSNRALCDTAKDRKDLLKECVATEVKDNIPPPSSPSTTASTDIYADLASALGNTPNSPNPNGGRQALLQKFFVTCMSLIAPMCETKAYCDQKKLTTLQPGELDRRYPDYVGLTFSCPAKFGEKSCNVQNKIRAYRANIAALQQISTQVDELKVQPVNDFKTGANQQTYDPSRAAGDRTIESITTVTSADIKDTVDSMNTKYAEEFTDEDCENNPENKKCEKFFYSEEEAVRFANQGVLFDAATEREKAEISKLSSDKLGEYLAQKGYKDLKEELDAGTPSTDIVAKAQARFEAERTASYASLESQFTAKQTTGKNPTQIADLGKNAVKEFQKKNNDFTQLLLFNNVVTSFLRTESPDGNGTRSNSGVLERELRGDGIDAQVLGFFQNLGSSGGGSSSSAAAGANETISVDLGLIDNVITGSQAKDPAAGDLN